MVSETQKKPYHVNIFVRQLYEDELYEVLCHSVQNPKRFRKCHSRGTSWFPARKKLLRSGTCTHKFGFQKVDTDSKRSLKLKRWRLKTNPGKTVHCVFYLTRQHPNRQLYLQIDGKAVKNNWNLKYLGIILDGSLMYRPQLADTRNKLRSRTNMLYKLARTTWGCTAKTLRITTSAMVMSVANYYCSPIWMNSAHLNQVVWSLISIKHWELWVEPFTHPKSNGCTS